MSSYSACVGGPLQIQCELTTLVNTVSIGTLNAKQKCFRKSLSMLAMHFCVSVDVCVCVLLSCSGTKPALFAVNLLI